MTITDTTTTTSGVFVRGTQYLRELDLKVDLGKFKSMLTEEQALEIGDTIFFLFPELKEELETAIVNIKSDDIRFVRSGLICLNEAIKKYNARVKELEQEEAIRLERELTKRRMTVPPKHLRPWLNA